jgi:hypothetical protein
MLKVFPHSLSTLLTSYFTGHLWGGAPLLCPEIPFFFMPGTFGVQPSSAHKAIDSMAVTVDHAVLISSPFCGAAVIVAIIEDIKWYPSGNKRQP